MTLEKNNSLTSFAIVLLLVGSISTLYVHATHHKTLDEDNIVVNNIKYDIIYLFSIIPEKTIILEDENLTGIPLDKLIEFTGFNCPECHRYTIIGKDGYQKTISWEEMTKGVFTRDRRVCFSDLPHAFWVRNVIEIEVN